MDTYSLDLYSEHITRPTTLANPATHSRALDLDDLHHQDRSLAIGLQQDKVN